TFKGFQNKVLLHSMLQKGSMELYGPDSLIINSCLATNLHRYGEFDTRINVHSDQINLSRTNKTEATVRISEYDSMNVDKLIEIKNLYFKPDLDEIEQSEETKVSLDNLARELQRYFAKYDNRLLLIHGHIDIGGEEILSIFRAEAIQSELEKRGITGDIFCIGHGSSQRKSAIRGDEKNRRVEIELMHCDSCYYDKNVLHFGEGTKVDLIKDLPDEYILNAQFTLSPGADVYVIMQPGAGMEQLKWQIPNISGGEMQALRVKKRYKSEEDAIMLEFYLDDVRVLTLSLTGYESFGFNVKSGTFKLINLNILGPDQ
ncbi:MAG: OmpA family protein, partial [Bacteroidia bacterium]